MQIIVNRSGLSVKQLLFLKSEEDEVLFGGARGGGKSWVARIGCVEDALNYAGRNVVFVRPTIKSAKQQFSTSMMTKIIPRSIKDEDGKKREIWRINKQDGYYEFANGPDADNPFDGGSTLILAGVSTLQDAQDAYQGIEFVSIWWDELTKADYEAITYMKGSLRDAKYPVKFRAASNPGERSHKEVKAAYVTPWKRVKASLNKPDDYHSKLAWRKKVYDAMTKQWIYKTLAYIPATLDDNPDKNIREGYIKQLAHLPSHLFKMYREGSWDTYEGKFWDDILDHERFITLEGLKKYGIDLEEEKKTMKTFLSMDWGYNDNTSVLWHLETSIGVVVTYKEIFVKKMSINEIAQYVEQLNKDMGVTPECIYTPWDMYVNKGGQFRTDGGQVIGEELIDVWRQNSNVSDVKASQDRKQGWQNMTYGLKHYVQYQYLDNGKVVVKKAPRWLILKLDCPELVTEIQSATIDPKHPEDILLRTDHAIDAGRYFWVAHIPNPKIVNEEVIPLKGTGAWIRHMMAEKQQRNTKRKQISSLFNTSW